MDNKTITRGFIRKKLYALLHDNGCVVEGDLHKAIKAIFVEYGELVTTEAQVQISKNQLPKQRGFKFTGTIEPKKVDIAHKTLFAKPVMEHNPPIDIPPFTPPGETASSPITDDEMKNIE